MTTATANRILSNLRFADLDPCGNCFLVARALELVVGAGEMIECRLDGEQHVLFRDVDGLFWDLTADGLGSELLFGAEALPEGYDDVRGYEWPDSYSREFAADLAILIN